MLIAHYQSETDKDNYFPLHFNHPIQVNVPEKTRKLFENLSL